jgi:outer membrane protein
MKNVMKLFATLFCAVAINGQAAEKLPSIGIVNFATCIQESKFGKQEQETLETLKTQLQKSIEDIHIQLNDAVTKLQDTDYLDSLNPEAEKELKVKFQTLNEELNRYQGQYYQIIQQANMRLVQTMNDRINHASEQVAKKDKISLVINREAAFHFSDTLDITKKVIDELDKRFEDQSKIANVAEKQ